MSFPNQYEKFRRTYKQFLQHVNSLIYAMSTTQNVGA